LEHLLLPHTTVFRVDSSGGFIANASSTLSGNLNVTGALSASSTAVFGAGVQIDNLTSALILTGAGGLLAEYGGAAACTNQFVTALSVLGATTCATVDVANDVTGTLAITNGGTGATSLDDVLGTANEITVTNGANTIIGGDVTLSIPALFDISFASTTLLSTTGTLYVGSTATTTITGDTATSTFAGGIETNGALDVNSTGVTSTFANGIRIENGGLRLNQLTSCDTIDTDGNGNFVCGDDSGGGGQAWELLAADAKFLAPTTTSLSILIGTTTASASTLGTNALFNVFATSTAGTIIFASSTVNQTGDFLSI